MLSVDSQGNLQCCGTWSATPHITEILIQCSYQKYIAWKKYRTKVLFLHIEASTLHHLFLSVYVHIQSSKPSKTCPLTQNAARYDYLPEISKELTSHMIWVYKNSDTNSTWLYSCNMPFYSLVNSCPLLPIIYLTHTP